MLASVYLRTEQKRDEYSRTTALTVFSFPYTEWLSSVRHNPSEDPLLAERAATVSQEGSAQAALSAVCSPLFTPKGNLRFLGEMLTDGQLSRSAFPE